MFFSPSKQGEDARLALNPLVVHYLACSLLLSRINGDAPQASKLFRRRYGLFESRLTLTCRSCSLERPITPSLLPFTEDLLIRSFS